MRAEVDRVGLGGLVSRDGEHVVAKIMTEAETGSTPETFDPLMDAHNSILHNALDNFGLAILGDGCPLCRTNAPDWVIPRAVQDALDEAKRLGLVGDA